MQIILPDVPHLCWPKLIFLSRVEGAGEGIQQQQQQSIDAMLVAQTKGGRPPLHGSRHKRSQSSKKANIALHSSRPRGKQFS